MMHEQQHKLHRRQARPAGQATGRCRQNVRQKTSGKNLRQKTSGKKPPAKNLRQKPPTEMPGGLACRNAGKGPPDKSSFLSDKCPAKTFRQKMSGKAFSGQTFFLSDRKSIFLSTKNCFCRTNIRQKHYFVDKNLLLSDTPTSDKSRFWSDLLCRMNIRQKSALSDKMSDKADFCRQISAFCRKTSDKKQILAGTTSGKNIFCPTRICFSGKNLRQSIFLSTKTAFVGQKPPTKHIFVGRHFLSGGGSAV